jgi:hypothetical protein
MAFVVGVHTLALCGGPVTVVLGAITTVFHTSHELFFLLTALVLTYNYGHRERVRWLRFWRRRYWLIVPGYVAWTVVYYAFDGSGRGPFPGALARDLLHAGARYHMYFLLVTMQVYLLFPVLRRVLRKTRGIISRCSPPPAGTSSRCPSRCSMIWCGPGRWPSGSTPPGWASGWTARPARRRRPRRLRRVVADRLSRAPHAA